jgi:outer membrane receptor protein involved in Fe transport
LANFFVGDPNLKQVVSHSFETGLRGKTWLSDDAKLTYQLGLFHSDLSDDIQFINSPILGRAYFQNVGSTQRQGVDASVKLDTGRLRLSLSYAHTDATFRTGFVESSGSNPAADGNGDITVRPGNRLPGIPVHQAKLNANYKVTDNWSIGSTVRAVSGTYLFGDAANLTPKLPGYVVVNLTTSYQLTPSLEVFGSVENVTSQRYYVYGTFSPTTAVPLVQSPNATNPRSYNIAAPVGGYAGLRWRF